MRANCFKCKRNYNSNDPEDESGDFFCPRCKKESKKIALEVDEEIAKKRKKGNHKRKPKLKPFQTSDDEKLQIYNAKQLL